MDIFHLSSCTHLTAEIPTEERFLIASVIESDPIPEQLADFPEDSSLTWPLVHFISLQKSGRN